MSFWRFLFGLPVLDVNHVAAREERDARTAALDRAIEEKTRSIEGLDREDKQVRQSSVRVTDRLAAVVQDHSRLTEAALHDPPGGMT